MEGVRSRNPGVRRCFVQPSSRCTSIRVISISVISARIPLIDDRQPLVTDYFFETETLPIATTARPTTRTPGSWILAPDSFT